MKAGFDLVKPSRRALGVAAFVVLASAVLWTSTTYAPAWEGDYSDVAGLARWVLAAISEPQFYAAGTASALLLVGGLAGHVAHRRNWHPQGFVQACGTGIWPPVAGAALLSVLLSALLWGTTLAGGTWQPLFAPLVSVAPAVVVLYGPGRRVVLTAAVAGALLVPPAAIALVTWVCHPLGLPPVVGATAAMTLAAAVAFVICPRLPWMPEPWAWRSTTPETAAAEQRPADYGPAWVLRRALADMSEAQFFGNEWASGALLVGALLAYATAPQSLVYGSGLFLTVLIGQLLAALVGVIVWRRRWRAAGFYPTFVPVVSVVPAAVLACDGALLPTLLAAVAGAVISPPMAAAISARLPSGFHPFVGNVAAMSICTAVIVPLLSMLQGPLQ
ncbi:hypothetical protein GCM10010149_15950 [Nonomuraea roseoviolacea subsp. roseoviolacea]|uniref:Membrane protein YdbS with pleckstrin-like domain n=1 Tax=Nonomuraea roseoviolacea subsp. carminata TaxID=160689 RepID=A0ABT1KED6_9ACTN|nr:hypothetical protein [Nonomuraea roseoviolacea]MCP2352383.1 membrane protein YdbS with pleckstrin-like domain [Nonomuraea roseoviolacea subsp. carminata]